MIQKHLSESPIDYKDIPTAFGNAEEARLQKNLITVKFREVRILSADFQIIFQVIVSTLLGKKHSRRRGDFNSVYVR